MLYRKLAGITSLALLPLLGTGCDNDPVAPVPAASLVLVPGDAQIVAGGAITFEAQVLDDAGVLLPEARVLWSSSSSVIATVFPIQDLPGVGQVVAVSLGTATITATHGNLSAEASVTVVPDSLGFLASFNIEEDNITVRQFSSAQITLTAFDRRGQLTFANPSFRSSDLSVAEASCCYGVFGRSPGTAWIVATVRGGLRDSVFVTVIP